MADTVSLTASNPEPQVHPRELVYEAIANVMAELAKDGISKDRRNQQQNYSFRGVDDIYNALAPILAASRLIIVPRVISRECEARKTAKDAIVYSVSCLVEFTLISANDGSKIVASTYGEAMDSGDKATNKAMSAAYKYMAMQTFCIPTEGDNDADAHTPEPTVGSALISEKQREQLLKLADEVGADLEKFCDYLKVDSVKDISQALFPRALSALSAKKQRAAQ